MAPGEPGVGDIHTIALAVGSDAALDFWAERLRASGRASERVEHGLRFRDDDGLRLELTVAAGDDPPLQAVHPEVPAEHAIRGIAGARAYGQFHAVEERFLTDTLGFAYLGEGAYRLDGEQRRFDWAYDPAPAHRGRQGAGSVHHIAWASPDEDHLRWQERIRGAGGHVTDVQDRDYFESIYFREPRGILFEIATLSPGFAVDEDPDRLGEELRVPKMHAHLKSQLERTLKPVVNPRTARREPAAG